MNHSDFATAESDKSSEIMKKIYMMFAAAALVFSVSCVKDNVYDGPMPEPTPAPTPTPEPDPTDDGGIVLNELYGAASADKDKFIELYNSSGKEVTITGYTIQKDGGLAWTAPEGTKIAAKGFLAIIGAKGSTPDGFSSGFSAKKSVLVQLFDDKGTVIDTFQRGEEGTGWGNTSLDAVSGSWSRVPDGTGKFQITATPTPGVANSTDATVDDTVVQ